MLLEIRDLVVELPRRDHVYQVLNGVDLSLRDGETLGLVGESGCGKTMLCRAVLGLLPQPGARVIRGEIRLKDEDLLRLSPQEMAKLRGSKIGFIPQEPMSSLNPVLDVGDQLTESLRRHRGLEGKPLLAAAEGLLAKMHIPAPRERLGAYPHELSGGMRQRVLSAIALAGDPVLLLADEPTTALDATIQLQFLLLLREIQLASGCGIMFVTHDFGIVGQICDRVSVMYAGRVVESALVETLLARPRHPYAEALVASVPQLAVRGQALPSIPGQPPALYDLPPGCLFAPRCRYAMPICDEEYPPLTVLDADHAVSCWKCEMELGGRTI